MKTDTQNKNLPNKAAKNKPYVKWIVIALVAVLIITAALRAE